MAKNKLNIYACTGIGDVNTGKDYTYWTGGTNPVKNTQAENTILSIMNSLAVDLLYLKGLSDTEKISRMNEIDLYTVCLRAVRDLKDNNDLLANAGYIIGNWISKGDFYLDTLDQGVHTEHTLQLVEKLNGLYNTDASKIDVHGDFIKWWMTTIIPRNKVGLTKDQQKAVIREEEKMISGIGVNDNWVNDKNISNYLLNSSLYFTYYFLTEEQLNKLPEVFRKKHNVQAKTYYMCSGYFIGVYGSKSEMDNIIRSGITKAYGYTPEEVCESIVAGKLKADDIITGVHAATTAVTLTAAEIGAIIAAAVTAVATIIVAIVSCIKDCVVAKYRAVTAEQAGKASPNPEDYDGLDWDKGGWKKEIKSNWLLLSAIGVALVWLFKRNG